jgi:uncharacterized protein
MTEPEFLAAAFRNRTNRAIVDRLGSLGTNDTWLVSGALFQSVWNAISGRTPDYGIRDYDVFYFDSDLSWEAEDAVIKRASQLFADLGQRVEIRNQARVHLWYQEKFGAPYPALRSATQGIDRFLMPCAQVGIGHRAGRRAMFTLAALPAKARHFSTDVEIFPSDRLAPLRILLAPKDLAALSSLRAI